MLVFDSRSDPAEVERAIEAGHPFWLDVPPSRFGSDHPAARALGLDTGNLGLLDARGSRPGVFVEDAHAAVVYAGARRESGRVQRVPVVVIAGDAGVVTLRDQACAPLDELRGSPREVDALKVLDALTDSMLGVAEELEAQVEDAENLVLQARSRASLAHMSSLRQQVSDLLKIAREMRGMVERAQEELADVPVRYGVAERRVRDLVGHLVRTTDSGASTRQTIAEALDLYLSIAAENLTRIATVLLPLTVVSGFFGMNFTWMVDHIDTFWSFAVFGIGGMVVAVAGVRLYLGRKGYT
jgi:magnesium transporter